MIVELLPADAHNQRTISQGHPALVEAYKQKWLSQNSYCGKLPGLPP